MQETLPQGPYFDPSIDMFENLYTNGPPRAMVCSPLANSKCLFINPETHSLAFLLHIYAYVDNAALETANDIPRSLLCLVFGERRSNERSKLGYLMRVRALLYGEQTHQR